MDLRKAHSSGLLSIIFWEN
uniref:Uncharacterized protein n=1 Tax=Arundo donax TaxID=35708 RepID=A0A0A9DYS4_ARUDO